MSIKYTYLPTYREVLPMLRSLMRAELYGDHFNRYLPSRYSFILKVRDKKQSHFFQENHAIHCKHERHIWISMPGATLNNIGRLY